MKKEFKTLINETTDAKVLFTWGRFNPPTSGHEQLMKKLSSEADARGADFKIFPTKSEDPKKNPLNFKSKVKFMKKAFPSLKKSISSDAAVRTIIDALKKLYKDGYKEATVVVGSDRVNEFKRLVNKYNGGRDFKFDKVDVISAGERDPDATDVTGMSASKLRALALDGNKKDFMSGLPSRMPKKDRSDMFDAVRKGMRVEEVTEILDQKLLNEGIVGKAVGAAILWKGAKALRKKKHQRLNKDLDMVSKEPVKGRAVPKSEKIHSIAGSKFIRLLRIGLVKTSEISQTQQAFLNMDKSASAPPYRDLIFNVTQRTLDTILSDDILYRRFLVLLHRQSMFEDRQLNGLIKKSKSSDVGLDLILEVYLRGLLAWDNSKEQTPEQYAFDRVNSFLAGGKAERMDLDLLEQIPPKAKKPVKSKIKFKEPKGRAGDEGTSKLANKYIKNTPGQPNRKDEIKEIEYRNSKTLNIDKEFSSLFNKE